MTVMKKIEVVRERIRMLQAERMALETQPRTREAVREKVAAEVRGWNEQALKANLRRLQLLASGEHAAALEVGASDALGLVVVLLLGPQVVEYALLQGIDAIPEGVNATERAARLAAISNELDDVEAEEEEFILAAETSGVKNVWRRGDARPEIILGPRAPAPAVPVRSPHYQGSAVGRQRLHLTPSFPSRD